MQSRLVRSIHWFLSGAYFKGGEIDAKEKRLHH